MGSGTNTANLAWNGFTYPKLSYRCSKNLWDLLNCLLDFFCCHFKDNKTIRCNTLPNSVLFSYGLYRCPNVSLYHELFLYFQGSWWSMMNPWNWWKPRDLCSGSSSRSTGHMLMSSRLIHFEICLLFCFSRLSVSNISSVKNLSCKLGLVPWVPKTHGLMFFISCISIDVQTRTSFLWFCHKQISMSIIVLSHDPWYMHNKTIFF